MAALTAPTAVSATPITFAQFSEFVTGAVKNETFTTNVPTAAATSAKLNVTAAATGDHVKFTYTGVPGLPSGLQGTQDAYFKINAVNPLTTPSLGVSTTSHVTTFGTYLFQGFNNQIVLTFERSTPFIYHAHNYGQNLLTVTLNALPGGPLPSLVGQSGSGAPSLQFDNTNYSLTYTSDFLSFYPGATLDGSLTYSAGTPVLAKLGNFLRSFAADATGTFASDPPPPSIFMMPEPMSVALLAVGLLGVVMLRRRT